MSSTFRIRLWASCLLLTGVAFVQDPGLLVSDTKLDLGVAPLDFLGRALHAWDAEGAFGQLQNQAYGYFWPMGPFFALGWLVDLPAWVVQRLWLALVMSTALVGAAKVARAFGVRSDLACLVAGFAYALSPRMLTTLGPISIEAWPSAIAPWVLLALVRGTEAGSPRRWAALAGLGVALVGGVNAAATFAVLPMGVVWLLTREPGPRRRALMVWWPVFTFLGTVWWLVPLFVLGAYSPAFLDYIETTQVTTFPTTLFDTLRGTSNWVPYIDPGSRAGHDLITTSLLALDSGVLLMLGIAGMLLPSTRHRAFLAASLLVGVVMVTAGHYGAVEGWFVGDVRSLLDGVLAPLRNVHKFDPIVRLPLVLGLAFVVDHVLATRPTDLAVRVNRVAVVGMALVAVAGSALPAMAGRIAPAGAPSAIPGYWQETADWLAARDDDRTALLVPGSSFGDYQWGTTDDEPLQALASSRWAVRNAVPLAPEGNVRMLDEVERRLAEGKGSAALTRFLARAGVGHVVLRNDLTHQDDVPDPAVVRQAIADSPGLTRVATFGPEIGGEPSLEGEDGERIVVNGGWQAPHPAVEVFGVPSASAQVAASDVAVVAGGPEDLADLTEWGLSPSTPAVLAGDLPDELPTYLAGGLPDNRRTPLVLTDGLRSRTRAFGRIHDGVSAARAADDPEPQDRPSRDFLADGWDEWSTVARVDGVASVAASSSSAEAGTVGGARRGEHRWAALDGDPATAWTSQPWQEESAWWEVRLHTPLASSEVRVTGGPAAPERQVVRVRTPSGVSDSLTVGPGETRTFALPEGATDRIRLESVNGAGGRLEIGEVLLPGVSVERRLVLPSVPASWGDPDAVLLRRDDDHRSGCLRVSDRIGCVPGRERTDEEPHAIRRTFGLQESAQWSAEVTVAPRPGTALERLLTRGQLVDASASSTGVPDPRASALAAIDGDPGTSWLADPDDLRPSLTVTWVGQRRVDRIRMALDPGTAAQLPTRVRLVWPGGEREVALADGQARFAPLRTDRLRIEVLGTDQARGLDFDGQGRELGVGIGEVRLGDRAPLPLQLSRQQADLGCGSGPAVEVEGVRYETAVRAAPADLFAGREATARVCTGEASTTGESTEGLTVPAGELDVDVEASATFLPESVLLQRLDGQAELSAGRGVDGDWSGATARTAGTDGEDRVVALRENLNDGWVASRGTAALASLPVDGWQQGWWLPPGEGAAPVRVEYAADAPYRGGLLAGALAIALLALLVLWSRRWRDDPPPLRERPVPPLAMLSLALLVAGWVAGWTGFAIGLIAAAVLLAAWRGPDALRSSVPWLLGGTALAVACVQALEPWGSAGGWAGERAWPGYVLLFPVVGVAIGAGRYRTRRFHRSAGRSTNR
ncbi:DUF3367 domain-containing protein [Nocardioides panacisoli]|uniref:alpha-(1->3)-arabinofuranosyltransferase domain-containing protein n=1 Tax=Nocardioides panacisoli TaxID=627624 RepID=UPI001C62CE73|nr:alpha-(1->3)-arabinofuranosyltransferase family protein [Nocardioides panacisoli]QYJ04790.1 DUF3367 domain-containing protein [Nocardioides panacisoli]